MLAFILALVLLLIALLGLMLQKAYHAIPLKELKRRAAAEDKTATSLYRAAAYGHALDAFLWTIVVIAAAGGLVLLVRIAPPVLGVVAVVLLLWVFYVLLPSGRSPLIATRLATLCAPFVSRCVGALHPVLRRTIHLSRRTEAHTGLYERADLLELLEKQTKQPDSRFSPEELAMATRALGLHEQTVQTALIPWSATKVVKASDTIGPVLIDEIHKTKQPLVPVVADEARSKKVLGVLHAQLLGLKSQGQAAELMDQTVHYLHEDDSLREALQAFYVTNQPLFVVLDSKGQPVGVLTLALLLHQLLGEAIMPSLDYTDETAVAGRYTESSMPAPEAEQNTAVSEETVVE